LLTYAHDHSRCALGIVQKRHPATPAKELRTERARLRGLYLGMVDELAMAYGVHQALMTRN